MSDFAVEFEIARIGEDDGNAHAFEARFEDFEFAPGRNFAPIDDGHLRALVGAAPIDVAGDQRVEKFGAEGIAVRFECARELFENWQLAENFGESFGVSGAGGSLAVVFGEFQRIGKQESVETRRSAGAAVADREDERGEFLRGEDEAARKATELRERR